MRKTSLLPLEQQALKTSLEQFNVAREEVLQDINSFIDDSTIVELQDVPAWHKYKSGHADFRDAIAVCASKLESLDYFPDMHSILRELLVHATIWLAWLKVTDKQTVILSKQTVISDSYSTYATVVVDSKAVCDPTEAEVAEQMPVLEAEQPVAPERHPDATGPAPKKPKQRLLHRKK
jgi:hypothetical protein